MPGTNNAPGADEVLFQRQLRIFTQRGGPSPIYRTRYAGADEQYMIMGDVSNPIRGGITAYRAHDPYQRDGYRLIGTQRATPELPSNTVSILKRHGGYSWAIGDLTCPVNFYELAGTCSYPDNFLFGWSDFVSIYSFGLGVARSHKARTTMSDDNPTMDDVGFTYSSVYDIGGLSFGEVGAVQVEREVVDIAYASLIGCGNCGVNDDGTQRFYAVTKSSGAGSPGTPAEVIWTINGGLTMSNTNITGLGGTVDPTGLDIVGNFVVVLDTAGTGYWFAEIDPFSGAPSNWTQVTSGFISGGAPTDIYVLSNTEVYFSGRQGYIYRSTDITAGVTPVNSQSTGTANFTRITGAGDVIWAVGESGTVVRSMNRGATWAAIAGPTSTTLRAVECFSGYLAWIGSGTGGVWYTSDGGVSWNLVALSGIQQVDDIVAATDEVIHIVGKAPNSTTARLFTSYSGGYSWSNSSQNGNPRILNFQTFRSGNRLAVPRRVSAVTSANRIAIGGLSSGGTDGIITVGVANVR